VSEQQVPEGDGLPTPTPLEAQEQLEQAMFEIRRVIAGQDAMLERVLVCLLAQGHLLIEGVPGLAKTLTIKTTAGVLGGTFSRIQFTPDLVPSDLVGTRVYRATDAKFETELGPVFCNFLLADEINRAPAKVQSALLEVMQERQVTIGHETFPVPEPFLVMATQNPIESEGTYPLPEAQIDRFMLKVVIGYPRHDEELTVVQRQLVEPPDLRQALSLEDLGALQRAVQEIYVDPSLVSYAVDIATATREPAQHGLADLAPYISYGASPRGPISLVQGARALALVRGREYALVEDLQALALDALRHRLVLSYQALAEEVSPDTILDQVLAAVPAPHLDLARVSAA
jgi:MoxR-like ATPase